MSTEVAAEATRLTNLPATLLPGDNACNCLLHGPSEQAIRQPNDQARIPDERIIPRQCT